MDGMNIRMERKFQNDRNGEKRKMDDLILQQWYVLDVPWGDETSIVAGNSDPYGGRVVCDERGRIVCDNEHAIFNPEVYETDDVKKLIQNIMRHIVDLHNEWLKGRETRKTKFNVDMEDNK